MKKVRTTPEVIYSVEISNGPEEPEDYTELSSTNDEEAISDMHRYTAARRNDGRSIRLWFYGKNGQGYINPDGSKSATGRAWNQEETDHS